MVDVLLDLNETLVNLPLPNHLIPVPQVLEIFAQAFQLRLRRDKDAAALLRLDECLQGPDLRGDLEAGLGLFAKLSDDKINGGNHCHDERE